MIYCVEDERNIRELLVYTLGTTGFEAKGIHDGKELFENLEKEVPDLILLDIMLPGEDGYAILEKLKKDPSTREIPIIMVTAKEAEYDKVRGLDGGADDYITKPFGMMEFIARVKAVLRRTQKNAEDKIFYCENLSVNIDRHEVLDGKRKVELTYKEFEMLRYLMENQGIVLSRDRLLERIWGYDFDGETRTVDVHIKRLREKINGVSDQWGLKTIWGIGYKFDVRS